MIQPNGGIKQTRRQALATQPGIRHAVHMPKDSETLSPDLLLHAYSIGIFPMSEHRDDPDVFWVDPKRRGVFPIDGFRMSRSLARTMRHTPAHFALNTAFKDTVNGCADRDDTWINDTIFAAYADLHHRGFAHSFELWEKGTLIGGVYGVALGAAFFGESMFSKKTNASKMALAGLLEHLARAGFTLFDTQFLTAHLQSLGAVEITRAQYKSRLDIALSQPANITTTAISQPSTVAQRLRAASR